MDVQQDKCAIILDKSLPQGVAANTAAILGITLGRRVPDAVGEDVEDGSGCRHLGIVRVPVPVLAADTRELGQLRQRLAQPEFDQVTVVDFTQLARSCRVYDEFMGKMERTGPEDLTYLGLALCGPKKQVNQLTGSLPLLR